MKKPIKIDVQSDQTVSIQVAEPTIDNLPQKKEIGLLIEDYDGEKDVNTVIFLSKENAVFLAEKLLKLARKI